MKKQNPYELIVQKALVFMRSNLAKPITIPEVAQAISYSHVHLNRAFRKVLGETVLGRLVQFRLEKAKDNKKYYFLDFTTKSCS